MSLNKIPEKAFPEAFFVPLNQLLQLSLMITQLSLYKNEKISLWTVVINKHRFEYIFMLFLSRRELE